MRNLYKTDAVERLTERIGNLTIGTLRRDGEMNVTQMIVHCCAVVETANGKIKPTITWKTKISGKVLLTFFLNKSKSGWCDVSCDPKIHYGFEAEKQKLLALIVQFSQDGRSKCTNHPHKFLGKLTPDQWGALVYKHIDYHLRQFNA